MENVLLKCLKITNIMDFIDYLPALDVACLLESFDSNFKYDFDSLGCSSIKSNCYERM